jgi:REP element-mobilizing transposase RayT
LRSPAVSGVVTECLRRGRDREGFRLCHYSIQGHHLHLVVEADSAQALSRGLRALSIRIAMRLNRALHRKGRVFADRYYARALKSPTEVRAALRYVLGNLRRHSAQRGEKIAWNWVDRLSSGQYFDGWKDARPVPPTDEEPPVAKAMTWLLRTGWKLRGRIPINEVPGGKAGTGARS